MILACIEEASVLLVRKQRERLVHQLTSFGKPAWIEAGLVEGEQAIGEEGIILQVAIEVSMPIFISTQQSSIFTQILPEEVGIVDSNFLVVGTVEIACSLRETA